MKILQAIRQGSPDPDTNYQTKHIIKTLVTKGYLIRSPNKGFNSNHYQLTEKGAQTLREYDKVKKILEKTREGTHPSMDHQDR